MIDTADGACAQHAGVPATFTCPRCGAFGCEDCERRTRPNAHAMCPDCWERRSEIAEKNTRTNEMMLPNVALGLGVLALVPLIWPAGVGALIVSSVALNRLEAPHPGRKRATIGLALGAVGLVVSVASYAVLLSG